MKQVIVGGVLPVSIPQLGVSDVLGKVDTGAWSGALHCTNIRVQDGVLSFWPLGIKELKAHMTTFEVTAVRSANGQSADRYLIPIEIIVAGVAYQTIIGLNDRSKMTREILLGRRFLMENNILVDVARTKELDDEAERTL